MLRLVNPNAGPSGCNQNGEETKNTVTKKRKPRAQVRCHKTHNNKNSFMPFTHAHNHLSHTSHTAFGHARKATKLLSTNRGQHANKKLAPVDPSMQAYNKRHTLSQTEFQSLSGNSGYCWRYSAAQCLGMPYLVFEHMLKAMQAHIKKVHKEKDFPFLTLPLSDVTVTERRTYTFSLYLSPRLSFAAEYLYHLVI